MMLETWVSKRFGFASPVRQFLREVVVMIDVLDLEEIVEAYALEVDRKYVMTRLSNNLDIDILRRYLMTLLVLRIDFVNRDKKYAKYDLRSYAVPAFLAAYLLGIGRVEDHDFGLLLIPKCEVPSDMLTPDEMYRFSRQIRALRDAFRPVDFPSDRVGNLEFMSKFTLDEAVKSYRPRDHIVSAFMASVIRKTIRDDVILVLTTVTYGDAGIFRRDIPISEVDDESPNLAISKPQDEVVPQPSGVQER